MGNDVKIIREIKKINKNKNIKIDEKKENELKELCQPYMGRQMEQEDFMYKNSFKYLIQLSDSEVFDIIFNIFGKEREKEKKGREKVKETEKEKIITFNEIRYLYYSLTTNDPKTKLILIMFFIFQNKDFLPYTTLQKNIFLLFDRDTKLTKFLVPYSNKIFIDKGNNNKKKKKQDEGYIIQDFINNIDEEGLKFLNVFHFIKEIIGASEYKLDLIKNENINYICDCAKIPIEENLENNLDSMKRSFDYMTSKTNNIMYLKDFQKILENSQIHKNLINLVLDYFKKYTQKDHCCFNDLKYIFTNLNYSVSLFNKKKFLFKMILTIYNKHDKLGYNEINKYLNIDYDENKNKINEEDSESYSETDFLYNSIFDEMINKLKPYLENFGLIPYMEFKVKAIDKKIKRRLIKDILKNENIDNYEKYLENRFDEYDFFYAIDINFWNILMNENEEAPDYINNSKIAEEINIVKEEDKIEEEIKNIQIQKRYEENKIQVKNKINQDKEKEKKDNKNKNEENKNNEKEKNKEDDKKDDKKENQNNNESNKKNEKEKNEIKEENNKNEKNNENNIKDSDKKENKDDNNNKENKADLNTEKKENNFGEVITKLGRLKKGLKYKKDFIILCGQLYQVLKTNYKIDYIIKLTKLQNIIDLNINIKKKEENKEKEKEDIKDKKEENDKKEQLNENLEKKNGENEQKEDEYYIKKKELINEQLDKFIVDENKGIITKIEKLNNDINDNKYVLNELDFYPVQVFQKSLGIMVRMIEKAKIIYENLEKNKQFVLLSSKEQEQVSRQKFKERERLKNKIQKFYDLKEKLDTDRAKEIFSQNDYEIKLKELEDEYEECFEKKEKNQRDYVVDITMKEFIDNLIKYKNTILIEKKDELNIYPRYRTFRDIKDRIVLKNPILRERKFDIYYFLFSSGTLFKPQEDYTFENDGREAEDFIIIIVDIYSEKGESFCNLLNNKEKERELEEKEKLAKKEKVEKEKAEKKRKKIVKKEEPKKQKMTEEEKKELKEKKRLEKLEEERLEKERKEQEKEKKLLEKKKREEEEKKRKEREKIFAQKEKERKQQEKEEQQRQKKLQKEREEQLQREKEIERYIPPPYGISNFGNTCYFNSINQIFLNLSILQQIFLSPKIDCFINKENKFGHQGKFFEIYKSLYWIKKSQIGENVLNLKKMVGKLKEDFNNNRQQDANEYLNFVIDTLHEELNLHSTKRYIEEKDDIFKHNTEEEMGNISWANNLKRNLSFIDSIFMFQLKSNLKCRKCNTKKFNFETNYIFNLPLSLCKMVMVDIYLYRLPFRYKVYLDKIDQNFDNYIKKEENKNNTIIQNLWNYYTNVLTIEQKKKHIIKLHFYFDLEREKKMSDITKLLRGIKPLGLEPENIRETYNDEKLIEYKVEQFTDFITYSKERNKIIYPDSDIDQYVNSEDKIILNIYEVLNSNGMEKIFKDKNNKKQLNLYNFSFKKNLNIGNVEGLREAMKNSEYSSKNDSNISNSITPMGSSNKNENKNINIISFNDKMIVIPKEDITSDTNKTRKIITEFPIPIFHYWRCNKKSTYLFRDFYHIKIREFPVQYIILNNSFNISAKQLYEYIWNLNILYFNHPNIDTNNFWWNKENSKDKKKNEEEEENNISENTNIKKCYPFVLRYLELVENKDNYSSNLIHCPLCPWYSFCPGCIIDPKNGLEKLNSKYGIVVDWCYSFVIEEFQSINFQLYKEIDNQIISENLPIIGKEENYQSIKDCFELFFEEENLEDPLYCHNCKGPEDFSKSYTINRLPYVLILSLKRFKFNQNSNFKLRQMITYPLVDFEVGNDKMKKKYDLYGVVNHYGSISSGHYTAMIKNKENKWILCNDSSVTTIEENRVMNANAYILFYICKESPYQNYYIKFMKSLMNNIIIKEEKGKKETHINEDLNFFKDEPVITDYGEGYVIEENLKDFNIENYDIYKDLEKEDNLRIESIIKKYEEKDKKEKEKEKKEDKKEDKNIENQNNDNDKKVDIKEEKNNNENKNDEKKEADNNNIEKDLKNENQEKNEIIDNIDKNKIEEKIEKKDEIINKIDNKNIPEYYKDLVRIKFDYGEGCLFKEKVKKYNILKQKEEKSKKK